MGSLSKRGRAGKRVAGRVDARPAPWPPPPPPAGVGTSPVGGAPKGSPGPSHVHCTPANGPTAHSGVEIADFQRKRSARIPVRPFTRHPPPAAPGLAPDQIYVEVPSATEQRRMARNSARFLFFSLRPSPRNTLAPDSLKNGPFPLRRHPRGRGANLSQNKNKTLNAGSQAFPPSYYLFCSPPPSL